MAIKVKNVVNGEVREIKNTGINADGRMYVFGKSLPTRWAAKNPMFRLTGEILGTGAYTKYEIVDAKGGTWEILTGEKAPRKARGASAPKEQPKEQPKQAEGKRGSVDSQAFMIWSGIKSNSDAVYLIRVGSSYVTYNENAEVLCNKLALVAEVKGGIREVSFSVDMLGRYLRTLTKAGIRVECVDDAYKGDGGNGGGHGAESDDNADAEQDCEEKQNEQPKQSKGKGKRGKKSEQQAESQEQAACDTDAAAASDGEEQQAGESESEYEHEEQQDDAEPAEQQEMPEEQQAGEDDDNIDETAKAIAEALRQARMKSQNNKLDEDEVRRIIRDEIEKLAETEPTKVKRIKAKAAGKDEHRHPLFDKVLNMVANDRVIGRYPWLFGPAGSGKSTLVSQIAEALGLPFYSVSSLQQKYELEGYTDAAGELVKTTFYECSKHGGIFLFDEASTTSAEVQVAFNSMLANLWYNFPKEGMVYAHPDFHVIAADNTAGWGGDKKYHARFELDASTLDRYIPVAIDYTDEHDLNMAAGDKELVAFIKDVRKALDDADLTYTASPRASKCIKALQEIGIYSDEEIMRYGLCGGWSQQDIRIINARLNGNTKYHKMFSKVAAE